MATARVAFGVFAAIDQGGAEAERDEEGPLVRDAAQLRLDRGDRVGGGVLASPPPRSRAAARRDARPPARPSALRPCAGRRPWTPGSPDAPFLTKAGVEGLSKWWNGDSQRILQRNPRSGGLRGLFRPAHRRSCVVTPQSRLERRSSMSQTATSTPKNGLKGLSIERRFSSAGDASLRRDRVGDPRRRDRRSREPGLRAARGRVPEELVARTRPTSSPRSTSAGSSAASSASPRSNR